MPIVDIVQRSEKWHVWRGQGITASMIPVIMGLSPYKTPYELWAELVGYKEPDDLSNNYHVQRGVEQEPEARDAIENEYGKPYMPVCVEADHNSLFKASLDGLYKDGQDKEVLEIKCPCSKIYCEILELQGLAPTFQMYAAQVQWQLNCSGATTGRLYFYLRGKRPVSTLIRRNDAFIEKAEKAALHFWNLVQTKQPPEMIKDRDNVVYDTPIANTDTTWLARVEQYKQKVAQLEEMKIQFDAIKADLKTLESYFTEQIPRDVQTFQKDGIRATRVNREGSIDYPALIAELERELNVVVPTSLIEKHQKQGTSYFKVTVQEEPKAKANVPIERYIPASETKAQPEIAVPALAASAAEPQAAKVEDVKKPEKTDVQEEPELEEVKPLPAANFFEKSVQRMFF